MKKILSTGILLAAMCILVGCGCNDKVESAEEQAIGFKRDAVETVEDYNEDVLELENTVDKIEE